MTRSSARCRLLVALPLLVVGCSDRVVGQQSSDASTSHQDGQTVSSCACTVPGRQRCAGQRLQRCSEGQWTTEQTCPPDEVCLMGQCLTPATDCTAEFTIGDVLQPVVPANQPSGGILLEREAPLFVMAPYACTHLDHCALGYRERESDRRPRTLSFDFISSLTRECRTLVETYTTDHRTDIAQRFFPGADQDALSTVNSSFESVLTLERGEQGVFYRQTQRIERALPLFASDRLVGIARLADWWWALEALRAPVGSATPSPTLDAGDEDRPCWSSLDQCACVAEVDP